MLKRKDLKIILATIMCIFSLFVCFTGVVAWFATNKSNNASGIHTQIYTHDLDMSYRVYKYSDDEKAAIDATNQLDALTLSRYDSVIKSRNVNTPIVLEFLISGVALGDNTPIDIVSYCTDATLTNKVISNIIKIQIAPINVVSTNVNDKYNEVISYFNDENVSSLQFKNGSIKQQEITYTLNNYSSMIVGNSLNLFILIDYSETLVDEFVFDIHDIQTTNFTNDLTSINCIPNEN